MVFNHFTFAVRSVDGLKMAMDVITSGFWNCPQTSRSSPKKNDATGSRSNTRSSPKNGAQLQTTTFSSFAESSDAQPCRHPDKAKGNARRAARKMNDIAEAKEVLDKQLGCKKRRRNFQHSQQQHYQEQQQQHFHHDFW